MHAAKKPRSRGRPRKLERPGTEFILEAALSSFATLGYEGSSLRLIASKANVDPALISHAFGSKMGLWRAVIDLVSDQLTSLFQNIADVDTNVTSPIDILKKVITRQIDVVCDTPYAAELMVQESANHGSRSQYTFDKLFKPVHALLLPVLVRAQECEGVCDLDADFLFFVYTSSIAMSVAARPYLTIGTNHSLNEQEFRYNLMRAILGILTTSIPAAPPIDRSEHKSFEAK